MRQAAPAYPQLVPEGELSPPFLYELPNLLRRESAELIDGHLQHLASHEARCRLTLGRLAEVLLGRRVYRKLGFVRVGDYARERLGLSARQLQSLAQVTQWLEGHPELVRLFEAGEISWTELRKRVSGVGDGAGTEAEAGIEVEAAADDGGGDDLDDLVEGESTVEFCLPCPPPVRLRWRQAVELASRASGSPLAYWQAAEVIAAEALTGVGDEGAEARLAVGSAAGLTAWPAAAGRDAEIDLPDEVLLPDIPPLSFFPDVSLPADVVRLTRGLKTVTAHQLDARLRRVVSAMQSLDWQTGRLLRTLFSLRLHREIGFSSTARYIRSRLHISVRKARGLVAIERATLLRCPELSRAYRCGRISWLRALAILPVLTENGGHLWVERAARVTLRRLHDEVTWALNRADASAGRSGLNPPVLGAAIDTLDCELVANAAPDSDETADTRGSESPDSVHFGAAGTNDSGNTAASDSSESTNVVHFGARCCGGGCGLSFSSVNIRFFGPPAVVALLHEALEHTRRPGEPRWRAMERLLRMVIREWNAQPRHRDPVFARDGWRCTVPACSSRRNLEDHHLVFRSHGGDNTLGNRTAVCAWHHRHAIHDLRLLASRIESGALYWQLGIRDRGRPLMALLGDVYIYGAPSQTRGCSFQRG